MNLQLPREALLNPLNTVIGVVDRKQNMPILSNVLFSIKNNQLILTGTDAEIELVGHSTLIDENLPATRLTLPGRKLMEICRSLPENAAVELYRDKESVVLRSGQSRFKLTSLPAEHFPSLTTEKSDFSFTMPQLDLRTLLQRTAFTIAQKETRYYMNGLLLEIEAEKMTAVATDGHRLALTSAAITAPVEEKKQLLLPRKTVFELIRLLDSNEDTLGISVNKSHITINAKHFTLTSKLIESQYPNYKMVIPKNANNTIIFDKDNLKQALSRTAILCSEQYRGVRFEIANNLLQISVNSPDHESAEEQIGITFSGEALDIAFNVTYLIEALNAVSDSKVKLSFGDSNTSVIIEEENNPNNSLFVVMPMRL